MQRYFVNTNQINNGIVIIEENDTHHIKNVMRMSIGDNVYVCDNVSAYLCEIIEISNVTRLKIISKLDDDPELKISVTIAQGKLQREKEEAIVKAITQMGCYKYIGVQMDKSIVKDKKVKENKIVRIRKIIKEAAEQSQRNKLMIYESNISFKALLNSFNDYDLVILCDVAEYQSVTLKDLLRNNDFKNILSIIGPESGFSTREIEAIKKTDAKIISLGKRVLRTEVAPLFLLSSICYEEEL